MDRDSEEESVFTSDTMQRPLKSSRIQASHKNEEDLAWAIADYILLKTFVHRTIQQ